ncbi:phosphoglycerate mutase family protein [Companilactobacillus allii]|uniref:Histidine phosphatase family protein n=1 Tax=Companilactobacillus allii TaxID=1847728 RepID=A0A1P8Q6C8_9LACO|nr:histidine phosphatase family protein [Companilactobacillus allii]APX73407.1 histidine phosphatase family protein [Companilactobacillus allii]USQ69883.1 phosphoglycerate mutase family protein [Companilactobacillus allii]
MRHGQTLFNVRRKIQGWCDSPLTETGIKQAKLAGKYFKDNNINFNEAYCSTAERASDTLELVTKLPYKRLKGLREFGFGAFESESEDLNPQFDPYKHYGDFFVQYGGEDSTAGEERFNSTVDHIMDNSKNNDNILIVAHAGVITAFSSKWYDPVKLHSDGFTNCSILKFTYDSDKYHFKELINPTVK